MTSVVNFVNSLYGKKTRYRKGGKDMSSKWLQAAVLILIVYAAFASYQWISSSEKLEELNSLLISLSEMPTFKVSEAGDVLEHLAENSSEDVLRERVFHYAYSARTLKYVSLALYKTTGEERYRLLSTAMSNLEVFLNTVGNHQGTKDRIIGNAEILKKIGELLHGKRICDVSEEIAERVFNLSSELSY